MNSAGVGAHPAAAPGHPGNVSKEQKDAYDQLRAALVAEKLLQDDDAPPYEEAQLLRFLRARQFDVAAAKAMYFAAEKWKKDIELDRLRTEFTFDERDAVAAGGWRMYFHKTDKLGRPIFVQDLAGMNPTEVFAVTSTERIVQNFAVTLDEAVRTRYATCTEAHGRLVDDNFMVLNVAGLSLGTFWAMKTRLQSLLAVLDDNFPELSGRVQIINAPYLFSTAWSYIKGWLPAHTAQKIDICGTDYLPTILQFVDRNDWPKYLGGACTCAEGCDKSDAGPWNEAPHETNP